jgi:putative transposase
MGQKAEASLGIMDSQSVRWGNSRSLNEVDDNKKVKGINVMCLLTIMVS